MLQKTLSSGLYILHDIVILLIQAQLINAIKWPLELLARDFGFLYSWKNDPDDLGGHRRVDGQHCHSWHVR